jgi:hypothetical protein
MHHRSSIALALAALSLGCGSADEGSTQTAEDPIQDVRVAIPPADPAFIDFVSPEEIIQPGAEKLFCTHFRWDGEDIAFSDQDTLQGKYGHHAVLLTSKEPKEPGTTEDCSEAGDMTKYDPYSIPKALPPGYGVSLPKGKQFVLQIHYVNAGRRPIRVRDVVRLKKRPVSEVTTWTAVLATNSIDLVAIPPKSKKRIVFDCTAPVDAEILLVGGHMHEHGTSFELKHGADPASLRTIYQVPDWRAEYRDAPPVDILSGEPLKVKKGDIFRTTCEWNNPTEKEIAFPEEMCASFGYAGGIKEPITCREGTEVKE